jgi:molybdate transport repressor ModE-like protein
MQPGHGMSKVEAKSLPSLSVRIDLDPESRIGPGKIQLLEKIEACGSISAAGRAMDMSYKRAWMRSIASAGMPRLSGRPEAKTAAGQYSHPSARLSLLGTEGSNVPRPPPSEGS